MSDTTMVRLDHPLFRGSLSLHRIPKYLRFTYAGDGIAACSKPWDALDQPDDVPRTDEMLIAAVLKDRGTMHLDRTVNGRRVGTWGDAAHSCGAIRP